MPFTILCIDDEPRIVELIRAVLDHPDIHLLTAYNCEDGLKRARQRQPDLIILDVVMPDNNGWWVYENIRSDHRRKDTPIIMLTGILHRYKTMKEFSRSEIDCYITKPFDAMSVRKEVQNMLGYTFWSPQTGQCVQPTKTLDRTRLA